MLCGGDHRPKHYLKQSLTFLHDGKGTLQFLWHELRNHTASLSKFIAMLKPRLYFFSFPLLIFCYYFLEGALFVRSFAQLPVPFDPHPLKAWDVPAVSSSVWLPFFPLLPTGWLMPIPPCSPVRQLSWAQWPWAGFGQGGQQVCHTQPALTMGRCDLVISLISGREMCFCFSPCFCVCLFCCCAAIASAEHSDS